MDHIVKYNELFNFFKKKKEVTQEDVITIGDLFTEISDEFDLVEYVYDGGVRSYPMNIILEDESNRTKKSVYVVYLPYDNFIFIDMFLNFSEKHPGKLYDIHENFNKKLNKFILRVKKFKFKCYFQKRHETEIQKMPEFKRLVITR